MKKGTEAITKIKNNISSDHLLTYAELEVKVQEAKKFSESILKVKIFKHFSKVSKIFQTQVEFSFSNADEAKKRQVVHIYIYVYIELLSVFTRMTSVRGRVRQLHRLLIARLRLHRLRLLTVLGVMPSERLFHLLKAMETVRDRMRLKDPHEDLNLFFVKH